MLELFFEALKNNNEIPSNSNLNADQNIAEKRLPHSRHKSQITKNQNSRNRQNNFFMNNPNNENEKEEIKVNENNIRPNNQIRKPPTSSNSSQNLPDPQLNVGNLMEILYQERMFEHYRDAEKNKIGATSFQINRLPERKIDLEFINSHSNIDQDCVT